MTDDEYIGCRRFFQIYGNHVNTVVFVTNGERSVVDIPDMVHYASLRREESEQWIRTVSPRCQVHYLNVPDGINLVDVTSSYVSRVYESINDKILLNQIADKLEKIVADDILICPSLEKHPSHSLSYNLCELLTNRKIHYKVHSLFENKIKSLPGVYFSKQSLLGLRYFNYVYVLSEKELIEKRKEFEVYFSSQYDSFEQSNIEIQNWETYMSEVPLKLAHEDCTYKAEMKDLNKWENTL